MNLFTPPKTDPLISFLSHIYAVVVINEAHLGDLLFRVRDRIRCGELLIKAKAAPGISHLSAQRLKVTRKISLTDT